MRRPASRSGCSRRWTPHSSCNVSFKAEPGVALGVAAALPRAPRHWGRLRRVALAPPLSAFKPYHPPADLDLRLASARNAVLIFHAGARVSLWLCGNHAIGAEPPWGEGGAARCPGSTTFIRPGPHAPGSRAALSRGATSAAKPSTRAPRGACRARRGASRTPAARAGAPAG
jgi:hypothetical protein